MTLYCATSNAGKLREFRLSARDFDLQAVPGFETLPQAEETGATCEENAILKAAHYGLHAPGLLFADDSGLEVDALGGAPGVHSARFAGPRASDAANNQLLLDRLRGVENRAARFVCVIALVERARLLGTFRGMVDGAILEAPRGAGGFGYDPLFYYPPFGCTFGEASQERKFAVSHRGRAFREMIGWLRGRQD